MFSNISCFRDSRSCSSPPLLSAAKKNATQADQRGGGKIAKLLSRRRLFLLLAVLGPGIITSAADNDAGGIITYANAGSRYGYSLLWIILIITFLLIAVQEMGVRMGVVTQKGLGELIREQFGVKWTLFALITLLIANLATTVAEFAGIAGSLMVFGIPKFISVPVVAVGMWFLIVKGSFRIVEKVFIALSLIYATYIISGLLARPDWGEVARGAFIPSFQLEAGYIHLVIAIIGTTITPWMQFFLQATVVDKGTRLENIKLARADVYVGSILTDVVSFFIIVATATALYVQGAGVEITNAQQAAEALRPLAGNFATALFAIGLFNASLLASAVLPLSTAYTYSEAFGWEIGIGRRWSEAPIFYGIYTFAIAFGAIVVLLPIQLFDAMILSQTINGILLPVVLVFMVLLASNKEIMGQYANSKIYNILAWLLAVSLILLTVMLMVTTFIPGVFGG